MGVVRAGTEAGHRVWGQALQRPLLLGRAVAMGRWSTPRSAYARYAMPGTNIAYGATRVCHREKPK
eukprot:1826330-Rhodomonas_salina.1